MDPRRGPGHVVPHRDQPRPGPSLGVHDPAHPGPVGRQRPGRPAGRRVIAFDGKTMRGARTPAGAPHLVAAFDHAAGAVVGQLAVSAKSNEIPALRDLLESMDITDSVVTADAMHCLRETAEHITGRGGHYVLTVKANQCATRRSDVYPPQAGGTRREVLGSDDSPGAERRRGQQHVRKPAAGSGCLGRRVGKTRTVWQRLDCLNPNLQRQQWSRLPDLVHQEIYAYLIVHHAICPLIAKASAAADLDPNRISFAKTLRLIRRSATGTADIPP